MLMGKAVADWAVLRRSCRRKSQGPLIGAVDERGDMLGDGLADRLGE
jgi:hypothetical protein